MLFFSLLVVVLEPPTTKLLFVKLFAHEPGDPPMGRNFQVGDGAPLISIRDPVSALLLQDIPQPIEALKVLIVNLDVSLLKRLLEVELLVVHLLIERLPDLVVRLGVLEPPDIIHVEPSRLRVSPAIAAALPPLPCSIHELQNVHTEVPAIEATLIIVGADLCPNTIPIFPETLLQETAERAKVISEVSPILTAHTFPLGMILLVLTPTSPDCPRLKCLEGVGGLLAPTLPQDESFVIFLHAVL